MDWRVIVDAALEVTVVGSFSRIGPAVRRRLFELARRRRPVPCAGRRRW